MSVAEALTLALQESWNARARMEVELNYLRNENSALNNKLRTQPASMDPLEKRPKV